MLLISLIPMLMGGEIAAQSAINTKLKNEVGSPFLASTISFFVGTIFLSVLLAFMRPTISLSSTLIVNNPWWIWIGGFTSAFALTANVLLFTHLGSVQTSVLPIVGQIIMSVIIDQFGLFQSPQSSLTPLKIVGVLILLLGALFSANIGIKRSLIERSEKRTTSNWPWQLIGLIAGALLAVQAAVNGRLGYVLNSSALAAWVTCLVAFISLLVVDLVLKVSIVKGIRGAMHATSKNWWMWIGGLLGSSYVMLSAQLVPVIGTEKVIIVALFGQLLVSALIDNFGWFSAAKKPISRLQIWGLVLMLIAIIVINLH